MSNPVEPTAHELVLTRVLDAPRRLVFEVWTEPEHVAHWWGPNGFTNPRCELDVRPGGAIRIDMRGPDGTVYPMTGIYREVVEPERLVFVGSALDAKGRPLFEVLTTVTFAERRGKTTVTMQARVLSATPEGAPHIGGMKEGWTQSLERLDEYVASHKTISGGTTARIGDPATATDREIVLSRVFDAPRELVWEAWTDPQHVVHWWGPKGFSTTIETMDVKPGGVWKHVMHGPDGTDYPNKSVFTEVVRPERIAYSHGGGRKGTRGVSFEATWTFDALADDQTRVTIRQVFSSAKERDRIIKEYGAVEGGKQTLARLAEHLAKAPVVVERIFNAPAEVVWKAITDADQMKRWYFENLESFKPEVGFQTEFNVRKGDADFLHVWKVTEVVPGKRIAYSWMFAGYPGESLVTFALSPDGDKTKLTLTHEGLETFLPETHPDLARGNFVKGWTHLIGSSLAALVEGDAASTGPLFTVTRVFDAPRELAFRAWTEVERLREWWGPKGFAMASLKLDLRAGGVFHYCMRAPNRSEMWGRFVFREIAPPERIVFVSSFSNEKGGLTRNPWSANWPLEVLNTLTLTEHAGKTTLRLEGHPINATEEECATFEAGFDSMRKGFGGTFGQLAAYLTKA